MATEQQSNEAWDAAIKSRAYAYYKWARCIKTLSEEGAAPNLLKEADRKRKDALMDYARMACGNQYHCALQALQYANAAVVQHPTSEVAFRKACDAELTFSDFMETAGNKAYSLGIIAEATTQHPGLESDD